MISNKNTQLYIDNLKKLLIDYNSNPKNKKQTLKEFLDDSDLKNKYIKEFEVFTALKKFLNGRNNSKVETFLSKLNTIEFNLDTQIQKYEYETNLDKLELNEDELDEYSHRKVAKLIEQKKDKAFSLTELKYINYFLLQERSDVSPIQFDIYFKTKNKVKNLEKLVQKNIDKNKQNFKQLLSGFDIQLYNNNIDEENPNSKEEDFSSILKMVQKNYNFNNSELKSWLFLFKEEYDEQIKLDPSYKEKFKTEGDILNHINKSSVYGDIFIKDDNGDFKFDGALSGKLDVLYSKLNPNELNGDKVLVGMDVTIDSTGEIDRKIRRKTLEQPIPSHFHKYLIILDTLSNDKKISNEDLIEKTENIYNQIKNNQSKQSIEDNFIDYFNKVKSNPNVEIDYRFFNDVKTNTNERKLLQSIMKIINHNIHVSAGNYNYDSGSNNKDKEIHNILNQNVKSFIASDYQYFYSDFIGLERKYNKEITTEPVKIKKFFKSDDLIEDEKMIKTFSTQEVISMEERYNEEMIIEPLKVAETFEIEETMEDDKIINWENIDIEKEIIEIKRLEDSFIEPELEKYNLTIFNDLSETIKILIDKIKKDNSIDLDKSIEDNNLINILIEKNILLDKINELDKTNLPFYELKSHLNQHKTIKENEDELKKMLKFLLIDNIKTRGIVGDYLYKNNLLLEKKFDVKDYLVLDKLFNSSTHSNFDNDISKIGIIKLEEEKNRIKEDNIQLKKENTPEIIKRFNNEFKGNKNGLYGK